MGFAVSKEQLYEVLMMLLKPQRPLLPRKTIPMDCCSFCCFSGTFENILTLGWLFGAYHNS